jgi:hypothetical protein
MENEYDDKTNSIDNRGIVNYLLENMSNPDYPSYIRVNQIGGIDITFNEIGDEKDYLTLGGGKSLRENANYYVLTVGHKKLKANPINKNQNDFEPINSVRFRFFLPSPDNNEVGIDILDGDIATISDEVLGIIKKTNLFLGLAYVIDSSYLPQLYSIIYIQKRRKPMETLVDILDYTDGFEGALEKADYLNGLHMADFFPMFIKALERLVKDA